MGEATATGIVEHVSSLSFEDTLDRLTAAITKVGLTIFSRVDHLANAVGVGMEMPPTVVLSYGNPKGGTPIMLAAPLTALDLPLRVLIHVREDGRTAIAFHPIGDLLRASGVPEALAGRLDPAQKILVEALTH